jgi:hypothetical protein
MVKIVYRGPLAEGTIGSKPAFDFVRDVPIEVPDEFAEAVLRGSEINPHKETGEPVFEAHPDWQLADEAPRKRAAASKAKE